MSEQQHSNDDHEYDEAHKSKSQIKREMDALQALGRQLTNLNDEQLAQVPISDDLRRAITDYKRFKKNEARRRQMQYIGKLMRNADEEGIAAALHRFDASHKEHVQHFHHIERWRELLLDNPSNLTQFLNEHPTADAQHLRQLLRNASNKPRDAAASRKVFRYVREILDDEVGALKDDDDFE